MQLTQTAELTGSAILANNPIGVWGGATCLNIDVDTCRCDSAHQELLPVSAMGHEYVGVRYRNRQPTDPDETPPWRVVGAVDGTTLSYDPRRPPALQRRSTAGRSPSSRGRAVRHQQPGRCPPVLRVGPHDGAGTNPRTGAAIPSS